MSYLRRAKSVHKSLEMRVCVLLVIVVVGSAAAAAVVSVTPSEGVSDRTEWAGLTGEDSGEEGQYYDDEAGVTFVTDEDIVYEDARTHPPPPGHSHTFSTPHSIPVHFQVHPSVAQQGAGGGVGWEDGRCPPFPSMPSSSAAHRTLCHSRRCSRDSDCSGDGSLVCCYNGCIHACQHRLDPPLAFDWLEETELMSIRNSTEEEGEELGAERLMSTTSRTTSTTGRGGLTKKTLLGAEVERETIALPGGCFLDTHQYEHLRLFRKNQHVQSCTCSMGDVVCQVNVERDRLPSQQQLQQPIPTQLSFASPK